MSIKYIIFASTLAMLGCSKSPEWISVGNRIIELEKSSKTSSDYEKIEYRFYDIGTLKRNIDATDLTLAIQSGRAIGKMTLIAANDCTAPAVRNGRGSVMCFTESGAHIILAGDELSRSKLLHMNKDQIAFMAGIVIGLHGTGTPFIQII